jgi:hypothetical protein
MYQLNIGNPQQFMIPNQQQIPPQKLHDASNKTCKVTQHFIIHKSKEPNCQRQAGSSQLAKLPRFQHAVHDASMCLKTPGFAITAYNLLPFVGSIRSTETQCSLIVAPCSTPGFDCTVLFIDPLDWSEFTREPSTG